MKYEFPEIKTFKDIEHAIDRSMFMVAERNGHVIVNYLFASPDVFPDIQEDCDIAKIRREFRGLIFDECGNLIRRPYHKFFNVGERTDTQLKNIDVSNPHTIYDKLDGSMIAPFQVGIDLIWGTKMGDTDVAKQVERFVYENNDYDYAGFAEECLSYNKTPIFEWCSREQRIVLDYKQDELVLTAVRDMHTGKYSSVEDMGMTADHWGIPVCPVIADENLSEDFHKQTKEAQDIEGYVVRFDDGHMAKIKCDWYCELHRVKSEIAYERGVVKLILNGDLDDLKPLMPAEDLDEVNNYELCFNDAMIETSETILSEMNNITDNQLTKKDFALNRAPQLEAYEKQIIFKICDMDYQSISEDGLKAIIVTLLKEILLKNCTRNTKFDILRKSKLFNNVPVWRGVDINE